MRPKEVLEFWFGDLSQDTDQVFVQDRMALWFQKSQETDDRLRTHFGELLTQAKAGELDDWAEDPDSCLALILILDQFSRNLFRGTPNAFSEDEKALALASRYVERGWDKRRHALERLFLYLPFEHSEDMVVQDKSMGLYGQLEREAPDHLKGFMAEARKYAEQHRDIIDRFGRYPHRNAILGRASTEEELEFLKQPGSSF